MPASPRFRRVLIARAGAAEPTLAEAHGDYPDWFARALLPTGVALRVATAFEGAPLPDLLPDEALLITGSAASVRDEQPWMRALAAIAAAEADRRPVLAVCFGHQLVGEHLGGRVEPHAAGPEWGTVAVELTEEGAADPLFAGLPAQLSVQGLHRDHLVSAPPASRSRLLARNTHTPVQAFAWGRHGRAVQFHPELLASTLSALLERREWAATHAVRPSPHGARVLENWVASWPTG